MNVNALQVIHTLSRRINKASAFHTVLCAENCMEQNGLKWNRINIMLLLLLCFFFLSKKFPDFNRFSFVMESMEVFFRMEKVVKYSILLLFHWFGVCCICFSTISLLIESNEFAIRFIYFFASNIFAVFGQIAMDTCTHVTYVCVCYMDKTLLFLFTSFWFLFWFEFNEIANRFTRQAHFKR